MNAREHIPWHFFINMHDKVNKVQYYTLFFLSQPAILFEEGDGNEKRNEGKSMPSGMLPSGSQSPKKKGLILGSCEVSGEVNEHNINFAFLILSNFIFPLLCIQFY